MSRRSKRRTPAPVSSPQPRRGSVADTVLWIAAAASVVVFFLGFYFAAVGPAIVAVVSGWQAASGEVEQRPARVARVVLTAMLAVMMGIGWYLIASGSQAPVPEEFRR